MANSNSNVAVLIAGAGPAGLALALTLLKNNVPVRIIQKDDHFHVGSRGSGIQVRTVEFMQFLGILSDVERVAIHVPRMRMYKLPGGTEPLKTWNLIDDVRTFPSAPFEPGKVRLSQDQLEEILRKHLKSYGCEVELKTELKRFEQDENGVTTYLHHNDTDKEEVVRVEYLVGADGARGVVRKLLGLTFLGETRDAEHMIVGDVELKGLSADYWHYWDTPDAGMVLRSVRRSNDLYNFAIILRNSQDPEALAQPYTVIEFIHQLTDRDDIEFGNITWLSYFRPNMRMVNKFGEGRVFIAGDAAHVHSPTGGQGLNTGIQDSINLGWKLALAHHDLASPSLLESYNKERIPVIAEMLRQTTGIYTGLINASPGVGPVSAWQRTRTLYMLGINYRWSDIVLEGRTPSTMDEETLKLNSYGGYEEGICAGDRAPEAPGLVIKYVKGKDEESGKETSLFNLFDLSKHTILIFSEQAPKEDIQNILRVIGSLPPRVAQTVVIGNSEENFSQLDLAGAVDYVVVDRDNHARDGYVVKGPVATIFVIRPDTYIGAAVKDAEGVKTYFEKILK